MLGDGVAQLAQIARKKCRSLLLMVRELGIAMELFVGFGERRQLRAADAATLGGGRLRPVPEAPAIVIATSATILVSISPVIGLIIGPVSREIFGSA